MMAHLSPIRTSPTRREPLRRVAQAAFAAALLFALVMALLPHPPATPVDGMGDKFEHALAFGTLALLADFAFLSMPRLRIAERLASIGLLIEVLQAIPALHRDCDIMDWLTEVVAILAVQGLLWLRWPDRFR